MQVNAETLARMAGKATNDNMRSVIDGLALAGIGAGGAAADGPTPPPVRGHPCSP